MLRILSECSASVRKSLQGLDYITSEGAKAFDDLSTLITEETGAVELQEALKTGKLYLKGDFKVITVHVSPLNLSCTRNAREEL